MQLRSANLILDYSPMLRIMSCPLALLALQSIKHVWFQIKCLFCGNKDARVSPFIKNIRTWPLSVFGCNNTNMFQLHVFGLHLTATGTLAIKIYKARGQTMKNGSV